MSKAKRAVEHYRTSNLEAAHIILADVQRYGGPDSLMATWAKLFIERIEARPEDREAGPLFAQRAA